MSISHDLTNSGNQYFRAHEAAPHVTEIVAHIVAERPKHSGSRLFVTGVLSLVALLGITAATAMAGVSKDLERVRVIDALGAPDGSVLMADDGFRPEKDGFSFANWTSEIEVLVDASVLVSLFGFDSVCASGDDSSCVMYPAAELFAKQMNDAIAQGKCEGLAVLASRFKSGRESVKSFQVQSVSDIERGQILKQIAYWWTTQATGPVFDASFEMRQKNPSDIVEALVNGLSMKSGHTLSLHSQKGSHTVLPFAVTRLGNNFDVWVYDANTPQKTGRLTVNIENQTWIYSDGSIGEGVGSLDITPMDSREVAFSHDFSGSTTGDSGETYSVVAMPTGNSSEKIDLNLSLGSTTFNSSNFPALVASGITVNSMRAANGGQGMMMTLPAADGIKVAPQFGSARTNIAIERAGTPRLDIFDAAAGVTVGVNPGDNRVEVSASDSDMKIQITSGTSALSLNLEPGQTMASTVSSAEGNTVGSLEVKNEFGRSIFTMPVEMKEGEQVSQTTISVDPVTGAVSTVVEITKPVSIAPIVALNKTESVAAVLADAAAARAASLEAPTTTVAPAPTTTTTTVPPTTVPPTTVPPTTTTTTVPPTTTTTTVPPTTTTTTVPPTTTTTTVPPRPTPRAELQFTARHIDGWQFAIANYDPTITYSFESESGITVAFQSEALGVVNVSGLELGESTQVTVVSLRSGMLPTSTVITGEAMKHGMPAVFDEDEIVPGEGMVNIPIKNYFELLEDGYSVNVWVNQTGDTDVNLVQVAIDGGIAMVTGLAPGQKVDITVETTKTDHQPHSAVVSGRANVFINVSDQTLAYTGKATGIEYSIEPNESLEVSITYNGAETVPTLPGQYAVEIMVISEGYTGAASATLTIETPQLVGIPESLSSRQSVDFELLGVGETVSTALKVHPGDPCTVTRVQWTGDRWTARLTAKDQVGICRLYVATDLSEENPQVSAFISITK